MRTSTSRLAGCLAAYLAIGISLAAAAPQKARPPIGGARGAALAAAAEHGANKRGGVNSLKSGGRFKAATRGRSIIVVEEHAPGVFSTHVFSRSFWSKTYKRRSYGPSDLQQVPDDDPAFADNARNVPGPGDAFSVLELSPGEHIDSSYARALGQAKRTGREVIFIHNDHVVTVSRKSPATFDAYEATMPHSIPRLRQDL